MRRYGNIIKLISVKTEYGRLAQLVEHLLDVQEVTGSSPVPSTMIPRPFGLGIFLWWAVQDLHTVRPAVPVVVPPSSAGKRAIKKQFCRSRTARFAIRGKSALAELGCTTCSLQTVLHETEARFCLILCGFSSLLLFVHQFLNPQFCELLSDFNPNLFLMCRLLC